MILFYTASYEYTDKTTKQKELAIRVFKNFDDAAKQVDRWVTLNGDRKRPHYRNVKLSVATFEE